MDLASSKVPSYAVRFENTCGKTLEAIAFDCDGFQGTAWGVERHGKYCVLTGHDDVQAGETWHLALSVLVYARVGVTGRSLIHFPELGSLLP